MDHGRRVVELDTLMENQIQGPIKGNEHALEKLIVLKGYPHMVGRHVDRDMAKDGCQGSRRRRGEVSARRPPASPWCRRKGAADSDIGVVAGTAGRGGGADTVQLWKGELSSPRKWRRGSPTGGVAVGWTWTAALAHRGRSSRPCEAQGAVQEGNKRLVRSSAQQTQRQRRPRTRRSRWQ